MFPYKTFLVLLLINCCFSIDFIKCYDDGGSEDDPNGDPKAKEERESKEMESFMKLMVKSSQKNLKRLLETTDIGAITSPKCNSSWHQFMVENELSPERFSSIMEDYRSGNHEKIAKIVRPEQCLISDNGKFCQIDHITNVTMRSKSRVFDMTYALCYPRGCTNDELNDILTALTETYKGSMFQVKLDVVKCITSMENVTKMEIDTAQKMLSKMSKIPGMNNQTLQSLPGPMRGGLGPNPYVNEPNIPSKANIQYKVPDDIPMFTLEDLGIPKQLSPVDSYPPRPYPQSVRPSYPPPPPSMPPVAPQFHHPVESTKPSEMKSSTSTVKSDPNGPPYYPPFKWPESETDASSMTHSLRYPDTYYSDSDELSVLNKSPFPMTASTLPPLPSSSLETANKPDKTRLLKMIPGLVVHEDDD